MYLFGALFLADQSYESFPLNHCLSSRGSRCIWRQFPCPTPLINDGRRWEPSDVRVNGAARGEGNGVGDGIRSGGQGEAHLRSQWATRSRFRRPQLRAFQTHPRLELIVASSSDIWVQNGNFWTREEFQVAVLVGKYCHSAMPRAYIRHRR